jgi:hypothetical protein
MREHFPGGYTVVSSVNGTLYVDLLLVFVATL